MKNSLFAFLLVNLSGTFAIFGQQIFVYDQQSSVDGAYREGGANIQPTQPMGQSFTPTFNAVGFVRIHPYDADSADGVGGTLYLNLRADSITGPILGTSDAVTLPNFFARPVDFIFSTPVPVAPGTSYFFQPVVQNGNTWGVNVSDYNYSGGTAFFNGNPAQPVDLWFREGIVVPEPSSVMLILLGGGGLLFALRRRFARPVLATKILPILK